MKTSKPKDRLMPKSLYQIQYFFEATCEYVYDMHYIECKDILYKIFPDNRTDVDKKIDEYLEKGIRSIYQHPFTAQDEEMERFIANATKP